MSGRITSSQQLVSRNFDLIKDSMLQSDDLPLSEAINNDRWQAVFEEHEIDFGSEKDAAYTPVITLWALISQVFFKEEMRSCKAAVGRVAALWAALGKKVCSTNTGAYCRARVKISWEAIRDICYSIAASAEATFDASAGSDGEHQHEVVAAVQSVAVSGKICLVDGFTVTAADTEENQEAFPQDVAQKEGLGFPIIRGVSLVSMVTGLLIALELGPYAGKQSGETALLWTMLDIRSIKCSLGMDIVRAKSPEMVKTEIWSCLLAYNLIVLKMLQAAAISGRMPRSLSFTSTMQSLASGWVLSSVVQSEALIKLGLAMSSSQTVGPC